MSRSSERFGLALRGARDEHPPGDAAEEAAGLGVLVAVVEARALAAVQRRPGRPRCARAIPPAPCPPTPRDAAASTSARDHFTLKLAWCRPQPLLHLEAPRAARPGRRGRACGGPWPRSSKWCGVHDHLPHLLGRDGEVDRGGHEPVIAPTSSSVRSQSRSARSTAASKPCRRTPNAAAATVVAHQQIVFERLHQRADQRRVLARDRGGDHGRQRREVEADVDSDGRRIIISVGDAGDHGGVGVITSGPSDVPRPAHVRAVRRRRRAGEEGEHVAPVDGRPCGSPATRAAPSPGMRSISRTRKRKERERAPITIEARNATPSPARRRAARFSTASREPRWREGGASSRHDSRRGRPPAAAPALGISANASARAPLSARGKSSSSRALHRVDKVVRDLGARERVLEAGARLDVAEHEPPGSGAASATRSGERANPRTWCPSRAAARRGRADVSGLRRRGSASPPRLRAAPKGRICILLMGRNGRFLPPCGNAEGKRAHLRRPPLRSGGLTACSPSSCDEMVKGVAGVGEAAKVSCEDCFFSATCCARWLDAPCPTFRPDHPEGLRRRRRCASSSARSGAARSPGRCRAPRSRRALHA